MDNHPAQQNGSSSNQNSENMDLGPPAGNPREQVAPRPRSNNCTAGLIPIIPGFVSLEDEQRQARERQNNNGNEDTVEMHIAGPRRLRPTTANDRAAQILGKRTPSKSSLIRERSEPDNPENLQSPTKKQHLAPTSNTNRTTQASGHAAKKPKRCPEEIFAELFTSEDILLEVASHLPLKDVINLYSVSKVFHHIFDQSYATYVQRMARSRLGGAIEAFPPSFYRDLWIPDPKSRSQDDYTRLRLSGPIISTLHADTKNAALLQLTPIPNQPSGVRMVPSLRYLGMLEWRDKVIGQIIMLMYMSGHRLPTGAHDAFRKMWAVMDCPTNRGRIALIRNRTFVTNADLVAMHFIMFKLDMLFNDPISGGQRPVFNGLNVGPTTTTPAAQTPFQQTMLAGLNIPNPQVTMRELTLAHRDLKFLWRVLRREEGRTYMDLMRAYVEVKWRPGAAGHGHSLLGVPADKVGALGMEYWGRFPPGYYAELPAEARWPPYLIPPDELAVHEGVRRGLALEKKILQFMTFGYLKNKNGKPLPSFNMQSVWDWMVSKHPEAVESGQWKRDDFPESGDWEENYDTCVKLMKRLLN